MAASAVKGSWKLEWDDLDWEVNAIGEALATLLKKAAMSIQKATVSSTTRQTGFNQIPKLIADRFFTYYLLNDLSFILL